MSAMTTARHPRFPSFLNFLLWYLGWLFLLLAAVNMILTLVTDFVVADRQSFVSVVLAWSIPAYLLLTGALALLTTTICKVSTGQGLIGWGNGYVVVLVTNSLSAFLVRYLPPDAVSSKAVFAFLHWKSCIVDTVIAAGLITGNLHRRRRAHARAAVDPTIFD